MVLPVKDEEEYNFLMNILQEETSDRVCSKYAAYRSRKKAENFIIIDGQLYLKSCDNLHKKVLIQEHEVANKLEVLKLHDEKHYGHNRLYAHCKKLFFSVPRQLVRQVVAECVVCAKSLPLKTKEKMKHIIAMRPWERIMIDLIDLRSYKESNQGFCWILTTIDVFSKFTQTYPLKKKSAQEVVQCMQKLIHSFGAPSILQSDNGKEFKNTLMDELCNRHNILFLHGRPRHPQTQGQIERFNQTLTRYISKHLLCSEEGNGNKNWLAHLDKITYDYNLAVHSATNKAPFELLFNRSGFNTVKSSFTEENEGEISDLESNWTEGDIAQHQLKYFDRMNRTTVHHSKYDFEIGDNVLVKKDFDTNSKTKREKLESFYFEQAQIVDVLSNDRLQVDLDGKLTVVSMNLVKKINRLKNFFSKFK
jgi:transposase InsO family protein